MPEFAPYPNEGSAQFAQRMKRGAKGGGIVKAANRFMQSAAQKDQKKGTPKNY